MCHNHRIVLAFRSVVTTFCFFAGAYFAQSRLFDNREPDDPYFANDHLISQCRLRTLLKTKASKLQAPGDRSFMVVDTFAVKIVDNYAVREMAKGYNVTIIPPEIAAGHRYLELSYHANWQPVRTMHRFSDLLTKSVEPKCTPLMDSDYYDWYEEEIKSFHYSSHEDFY